MKCYFAVLNEFNLSFQVMQSLALGELKKVNAAKLEEKRIDELRAEVIIIPSLQ